LSHLNVLIPVLDDEKHYWVGDDEVEKLLRRGGDWLPAHPAKETIARRYLKHQRDLTRQDIAHLTAVDGREPPEDGALLAAIPGREESLERRISLNRQRLSAIARAVRESGATSFVDLGCGDGKLLRELLARASKNPETINASDRQLLGIPHSQWESAKRKERIVKRALCAPRLLRLPTLLVEISAQ